MPVAGGGTATVCGVWQPTVAMSTTIQMAEPRVSIEWRLAGTAEAPQVGSLEERG
jgi:hypothetical protein